MSYIVLDLEWNQAMSSNASVFNRLPIHLSGEIIQIGAVKLDDDFCLRRNSSPTCGPYTSAACITKSKS